MLGTLKAIGLTAALSAGVVTAYDMPQLRGDTPAGGKTYYDRILPSEEVETVKPVRLASALPETTGSVEGRAPGKGDQLAVAGDCAAQTWPNISRDCLVAENGIPVRKPARTVTIERRDGASSSALVRVPAAEVAAKR